MGEIADCGRLVLRQDSGVHYRCCRQAGHRGAHAASRGHRVEVHREKARRYYNRHQESIRERLRLAKDMSAYGLEPGEREALELAQGGVCAICSRPPKRVRLAVDHCHKCDRVDKRRSVRGLLCFRCNNGIFSESPETLRKAADYFEAHVCTPKPSRRRGKP